MSVAVPLDIDALCDPMMQESPNGVPLETEYRLNDLRTGADWPEIVSTATETLRNTSKDLTVAVRLVEALTNVYGFAGLREGLRLLQRLIDVCWEHLKPPIRENGDLKPRKNRLAWLGDADQGAFFPETIRRLPLIFGGDGKPLLRFVDWKESQKTGGKISAEQAAQAVRTGLREQYEATAREINDCREQLEALTQSLKSKMGSEGPSFPAVRKALDDCLGLVREVFLEGSAKERPVIAPQTESGRTQHVRTRKEAYQQMREAAETLRRLEPHSPVPFLVLRMVELQDLEFGDLIREFVRNEEVLNDLKQLMGKKERTTTEA